MKLEASDISRVEKAIEGRQDWLASIIDSAMDAIITVDMEQNIVLFNKAAEKIFGITADDAIGENLDRFIPPRYRELHRKQVDEFSHSGVTSRSMKSPAQLTGIRANGQEFPIEATISKASIGEMQLLTVILREIAPKE